MNRFLAGLSIALLVGLAPIGAGRSHADTVIGGFDDLPLAPGSAWYGYDPAVGPGESTSSTFQTAGATFGNTYGRYDETYSYWSGFGYSNIKDDTTPGFGNQHAAYAGSGADGTDAYGVAAGGGRSFAGGRPAVAADLGGLPSFTIPIGATISGLSVTNTTYGALAMLEGDAFGDPFGGPTGDDPDWFLLTAYGVDASGNLLSESVDFYLADYRSADNSLDYIVKDWAFMDLSSLAGAVRIVFNVTSSDVGPWGMNTPASFAIDSIRYTTAVAVPEPASLAMCATGLLMAGLIARRRRA